MEQIATFPCSAEAIMRHPNFARGLQYVTEIVQAINLDTFLMWAGLVWEPSPVRKPGVVKRRFVYRC